MSLAPSRREGVDALIDALWPSFTPSLDQLCAQTAIFPASRTTDARQHSYTARLEDLEPGEHTVVVRVYDQFDNPVLAKTTFLVQ